MCHVFIQDRKSENRELFYQFFLNICSKSNISLPSLMSNTSGYQGTMKIFPIFSLSKKILFLSINVPSHNLKFDYFPGFDSRFKN